MTIPDWVINSFAVFGFICAWCVITGLLASRFFKFSKESEDEHARF